MVGRKKPLVVITRKLPDPVETRMRELFDARLNLDDHRMSSEELTAAVREAAVLVPTITDRIDAALIEQAGPSLKLIANFGNGVDKIDVAAAAKKGITVLNAPGTIDADYRGEIKVILVNLSNDDFLIENGERIAQMVIAKHERVEWMETSVLVETARGAGGFGHTGNR